MQLWRLLTFVVAASCVGVTAQAMTCTPQVKYISAPVNRCFGSDVLRITAVGDVLLHSPLQRRGYSDANGFRSLWREVEAYFRAADINYANLEGPVAPGRTKGFGNATDPGKVFDNRVYSSYPLFNYHPSIITDLKNAGITLVSTANNHSLDRGSSGADLTIDNLQAQGLPYFGTIKADAPRDFVTYTSTKMGKLAWIACSYSTNGVNDPKNQVLMCYGDREELLGIIATEAARQEVAGVIVTPHWGYEYQHSPNANQRQLAKELVAAGATAVIGTHPHVVQPWEYVARLDGSQSLVIYSTGNFVSGQVGIAKRTGVLAWIELCRQMPSFDLASAVQSRLAVSRAGWVALSMTRTAAGPEVFVASPASKGVVKQSYDLAAKYLPKDGLTADLTCSTPETKPTQDLVQLQ